MSDSLNLLERRVLEKIAEGASAGLRILQTQVRNCAVKDRELTGYGFFTKLAVPVAAEKIDGLNLKFGDVVGSVPGLQHGVGFLVYIKDGVLDMLEGYSYDEPWTEITEIFDLEYMGGRERDLNDIPLPLR